MLGQKMPVVIIVLVVSLIAILVLSSCSITGQSVKGRQAGEKVREGVDKAADESKDCIKGFLGVIMLPALGVVMVSAHRWRQRR